MPKVEILDTATDDALHSSHRGLTWVIPPRFLSDPMIQKILLWVLASLEGVVGVSVLAFGLLGIRSYLVHQGRDTFFLALVLGVSLIGVATISAAWTLTQQRYHYQLLTLLLVLVPYLLIATD